MSTETAAPMAGADLDARVATELLGWTMGHGPFGDVRYYDPEHVQFKGMIVFYPAAELPRFSTSLDAALVVVEHLRLQGWHWRMEDMWASREWRVEIERACADSGLIDACDAWAEGLSLAICVAALETLEEAG